MHKGYAFVQFTNPFDARNACLGEDGRNILSQTLGELCVRQGGGGGGGWTFFGWLVGWFVGATITHNAQQS